MMTYIVFFEELELVCYDALDIVATLFRIGSIYGYYSHVDVEEVFERRGGYF